MKARYRRYIGSVEYVTEREDDSYYANNYVSSGHRGGSNVRWRVHRDPNKYGYRKGAQFPHYEVCLMLCMKAFTPGTVLIDNKTKRKHRVIITDGGIYTLSPYVTIRRWNK